MTERERLIELLKEAFDYTRGICIDFDEAVEINTDILLSNGIIVPPMPMTKELHQELTECVYKRCIDEL